MIEYIYFVKCPNCEDEPFYFFNDAKECAMGQLSKKPIITQTEVNRNDFGECTDSCDLGTVWSWEDMMKDVPADPKQTIFTKAATLECDNCFDQEFDELDNSLDVPVARKPIPAGMTIDDLVEAMEANEDDVECKSCGELFDKSECVYDKDYHGWLCWPCQRAVTDHGGALNIGEAPLAESSEHKDSVEFHYDNLTVDIVTKVIPATYYDPEEYEEEEYTDEFDFEVDTSTVEEVLWDFLTEDDVTDVPGGLEALEDEDTWRAFLDSHFEDLLEKYNDKFLEHFKEAAEEEAREVFQERYAELHGEGPDPDRAYDEWRDSQYFEEECPRRTISEAVDPREMVELEYDSLTIPVYSAKYDVDDWDEFEHTDSFVYLVPKVEVATAIWDNFLTDEDVAEVPGGMEALENDTAWEQFLETNFDNLFEKYNKQILDHFKAEATEDFRERYQEEHQMNKLATEQDHAYDEWRDKRYFGESKNTKPFLEEFDDAETNKANLTDCPECGTVSYDVKEQYCTNCGLGL